MSYTPPVGNAIVIDFASGYTPPAGNAIEIVFSDDSTILLSADFVTTTGMTASLNTAVNLAADFSNTTGMSANLGNKWTEVMYIDNYLILIE